MARLLFLGTKGEIEESTPRHQYNASLLIKSGHSRLLVDYGHLRRYTLAELKPDAILITHAHPDHYVWLNEDVITRRPVYLTQETLDYDGFRPENPHVVAAREKSYLGPFAFEPYRVVHSIRAPAVGWKITVAGQTIVYNSDLIDIVEKDSVLTGVGYYIGDGAAVTANLVRRQGDSLFGHTRMITQIHWCEKYGIPHIIFTHLGRETLREETNFQAEHPEVIMAYDNLEMRI